MFFMVLGMFKSILNSSYLIATFATLWVFLKIQKYFFPKSFEKLQIQYVFFLH